MALKLPLTIILSLNLRQQMHVVWLLSVALSFPVCMSHTTPNDSGTNAVMSLFATPTSTGAQGWHTFDCLVVRARHQRPVIRELQGSHRSRVTFTGGEARDERLRRSAVGAEVGVPMKVLLHRACSMFHTLMLWSSDPLT